MAMEAIHAAILDAGLRPDDIDGLLLKAHLKRVSCQTTKAIELYRRVMESVEAMGRTTDLITACQALGATFESLGRRDEAILYITKARDVCAADSRDSLRERFQDWLDRLQKAGAAPTGGDSP